ncbi:hypothetical protein B0T18DRAFT_90435 [Schizothecium vesticola]|uniref:Uncharacterized protein n=1 Tax=Schizothecium vesticola TaxID=314040 RepID=A0AA40F759_9PEZI|nr:hypothetical protein B0T18DRAFT_90435 [Schizothecium vesticola]
MMVESGVLVFWRRNSKPLKYKHGPFPSRPKGYGERIADTSIRKSSLPHTMEPAGGRPGRRCARRGDGDSLVGIEFNDGCATERLDRGCHEFPGTDTSIEKSKIKMANARMAQWCGAWKRQGAIPGEIPPESTLHSTLRARPLAKILQKVPYQFVCSHHNCRPPSTATRPPISPPVRKRGTGEVPEKLHWNRPKFCQHVVSVSSRTGNKHYEAAVPRHSFSRPLVCVGPSRRPVDAIPDLTRLDWPSPPPPPSLLLAPPQLPFVHLTIGRTPTRP